MTNNYFRRKRYKRLATLCSDMDKILSHYGTANFYLPQLIDFYLSLTENKYRFIKLFSLYFLGY